MNFICNFVPSISEIEKIRATISGLTGKLDINSRNLEGLTKQAEQTKSDLEQCLKLKDVEKLTEAEINRTYFEKKLSDFNMEADKIRSDLLASPIESSLDERKRVVTLSNRLRSLDLYMGNLSLGINWLINDINEHGTHYPAGNNPFQKDNVISGLKKAVKSQDDRDILPKQVTSPADTLCKYLNREYRYSMSFDAKKECLRLFNMEIDLVTAAINSFKSEIAQLQQTILKNETPDEKNWPKNQAALENKLEILGKLINQCLYSMQSNVHLITWYRKCYGESITQESINARIAELKESIKKQDSEIQTLQGEIDCLSSQLSKKSDELSAATEVLLAQYNTSAALLSALTIGIGVVTAGLLFQALTLAVVIPVVVVSLAAIGMWRYKVGADVDSPNPVALLHSNIAP